MKKVAKIKDIFLSVIVCAVMLFVGVALTGCGNKYEGLSITLSHDVITLNINDGVSEEKNVIATIRGDVSISREVKVDSDSNQLNIVTAKNDKGDTVITVSASAVCTNAVVTVKTLEGGKWATFLVNAIVPVKTIIAGTKSENFFAIKGGQPKYLTGSDLIGFEPATTSQKDIIFSLETQTAFASVRNNELTIQQGYSSDTIVVKATSPHLPGSEVLLTLDVLPALSGQSVVFEQIEYYNRVAQGGGQQGVIYSSDMVNLPTTIDLANNLPSKQSIKFRIYVATSKEIEVTPIIKSTNGPKSEILNFISAEKFANTLATGGSAMKFDFVLASEGLVGQDEVYFDVRFKDYNFSYSTNQITIKVKDSVNQMQMFVDNVISNQTEFTVYDFYANDKKGLCLRFNVLPNTVPSADRKVVLQQLTYAGTYQFWTDYSTEPIEFIDNKFVFDSGENIYVSAREDSQEQAQISIYSEQNPDVNKILTIKAAAGTSFMQFVNPDEVEEMQDENDTINYYYNLTSNELPSSELSRTMTKAIQFTANTVDLEGLSVEVNGDTIQVDRVPYVKGNCFELIISSVLRKEGISVLTLRQANGYYLEAFVRVVYELKKEEIVLSAPSPQINSAVGYMETGNNEDCEFRIAITCGNSVTITREGLGVQRVVYGFADNPTDTTSMTFIEDSNVLDTRFLSSKNQLKPKVVGQVWVKVTLHGQKLNVENKFDDQKFDLFFFVECYVPVTNLSLSDYTVTLYSQDSVGYADYDKTFAEVKLNMSDATYQNVVWSTGTGGNDKYQVDGKDVYCAQTSENNTILTVTAISTWVLENGVPIRAERQEFVLTATVREFSKEYKLSFKLVILRAVQVEKILALNVNVNNGIYIPLQHNNEAIQRQIEAVVQVGESGRMPYNTALVFEFLPYLSTQAGAVNIDKNTGLLTISANATKGDAGLIRIAPADRYNQFNQYVADEEDVALYIGLTVADGASRETSYRIASWTDFENLAVANKNKLHYTLVADITVNSSEPVFGAEAFEGGLYGALPNSDQIATLSVASVLFDNIEHGAIVQDLYVAGAVADTAFIARQNNGTIQNVHIIEQNQPGEMANPSVLTQSSAVVGGLVAINNGTIQNCSFSGQICDGGVATANGFHGGIAGENNSIIDGCRVELCVYSDDKCGGISAQGAKVGGLVGMLSGGQITNSYVWSFVPIQKQENLLTSSEGVGVLVGSANGGIVDKCFGFVQNQQNIVGESSAPNTVFKNAYIIYKSTDEADFGGQYYNNFALTTYTNNKAVFDAFALRNVWKLVDGTPKFVDVSEPSPASQISATFASVDNVFSIDDEDQSKAVMMYYQTLEHLNWQERLTLSQMNYYTYSLLFGGSAFGINAFSTNTGVVQTTATGIKLVGTGAAEVTFYSKYNADITKTYYVYVINPICAPMFNIGTTGFLDGYILNLKKSEHFGFSVQMNSKVVLDERAVEFIPTEYELQFQTGAISGAGTGPFSVNTSALSLGQQNDIPYSLNIVPANSDTEDIMEILGDAYSGVFKINLYAGADKISVENSKIEMEPYDETTLQVTVFSDVANLEDENVILEMMSYGNFAADLFENQTELVDTQYYLSANLEPATSETAEYFVYTYLVKFAIKEAYKSLDFSQQTFQFVLTMNSARQNSRQYGAEPVQADFELVVNSQEILSVTINHYAEKTGKTVRYDNGYNYVFYNFNTREPSNTIAPGQEGLLKIDLYPTYARYDYIDFTYTSLDGIDTPLMLSLMEKCSYQNTQYETVYGYRFSNKSFLMLEDGIRLQNSQDFATTPTVTTIYLGTYLPSSVKNDAVFEITMTAYHNQQVAKQSKFNLVVEYMDDAYIQVFDQNGNETNALAKGATGVLYVTVPKQETLSLESVGILGISSNSEGRITTSNPQVIEDAHSLTRTYRYAIYVDQNVVLDNSANYVTIEVKTSWVANGKKQEKISSHTLGIVDFVIDEIQLLSDKQDKTTFYSYIGVQSNLQFNFGVMGNESEFQNFLNNYYYLKESGLNEYGNYFVNYQNQSQNSFLANLYYLNGATYYPLLNTDGTYEANNYFSFVEEDGIIKITGRRQGEVNLRFLMKVQYPSKSKITIQEISFDFTVHVVPFSDEDLPLIIDNEAAFLAALTADVEAPQDYILMNDIYLNNYTPLSTNSMLSLDGNNYTVNIMSWNMENAVPTLNLALFNEIETTTTIKNLTVNLYHAGKIEVNTTQTREVNVAGLALTNSGIVYNSSVVAYKTVPSKTGINGLYVDFGNYVGQEIQTKTAGFVLANAGYITNSRVGGEQLEKISNGIVPLGTFAISSQGTVSGFVHTNTGTIASSFFANGTITNTSLGDMTKTTSGFAYYNTGSITGSYAKGTGEKGYSLTGQGITTSGIGAGFIAVNNGQIADCYANILLANEADAHLSTYQAGRLSAGFVHRNQGTIVRSYTASKIQDAKSTQMAFVGVDDGGNLLNTGSITHSYYYNEDSLEGDAYSSMSANLNIVRVAEPSNPAKFYGLSFADSQTSINGVWYSTSRGIELVSANQIAVSGRYLANEKRAENTGELISYNLPYYSGYEYGSVKNPIIIRTAQEFNRVFGGDDNNAGTMISSYYHLAEQMVFGNYRMVSNINLQALNPDTQNVNIQSTQMTLFGGIFDGNQMTISNVDITAQTGNSNNSFGLFKALENSACLKNLKISFVAVSAIQAKFVGGVVGTLNNSKLIGISVSNARANQTATIAGGNVVGGLVGVVKGASQVKNITVQNISVKANATATQAKQMYQRNLTNLDIVNRDISYAGGVIGVADVYLQTEQTNMNHKTDTQTNSLESIMASGEIQVRASTVGGVIGYLGPQTNLKDTKFEVGVLALSKLVAYTYFAGGIVGECYGNIDMAVAEHDSQTQKQIENGVSDYYHNPGADVSRGNMTLFEDNSINNYAPSAIGGLVGSLVTGNITHAYSKINVKNPATDFAGGIVGQIASVNLPEKSYNEIGFFEVYAFGDVSCGNACGGIVGVVQENRRITMSKVNAVNYWSLEFDAETEEYNLPQNAYQIYAQVMQGNGTAFCCDDASLVIYDAENNAVTLNPESGKKLPIIVSSSSNDDIFAITAVKFSKNGQVINQYVKQSFACLLGNAPYNMAFDPYYGKELDSEKTTTNFVMTQAVTPYYDLTNIATNGIGMDTYFIQANWDTNYWVRYSANNDLLPSLVTYSESMSYYIDVASDLQKMLYHPYATFIVRALDQPKKTINVGKYIKDTGFVLNNFAGTLKGLDNSKEYGFDFENHSSFIEATTGANFLALKLINLGDSSGSFTETPEAFVGSATLTTFDGIIMKDCKMQAKLDYLNPNAGLLANTMIGGYLNDISMENCVMNLQLNELSQGSETPINVGMVCGQIESNNKALLQMTDVCVYQSHNQEFINKGNNNITLDLQGKNITSGTDNINIGALMGRTVGKIVCGYTSASAAGTYKKGIGLEGAYNVNQVNQTEATFNGTKIEISGQGTINEINAGLMFGNVEEMNIAFSRTSQNEKLQIVGGILQSGDANGNYAQINTQNLGGVIGKVTSSASIQNTTSSKQKFVEVDVNIQSKLKLKPETAVDTTDVRAGMLIGSAAKVFNIDNIDTYGQIAVQAEGKSEAKLGGYVGEVSNALKITNAFSKTKLKFADRTASTSTSSTNNNSTVYAGGFVGLYSTTTSTLEIGTRGLDNVGSEFSVDDLGKNINVKYMGDITLKSSQAIVGGILGGVNVETNLTGNAVYIHNTVYGGSITLQNHSSPGNLYAGGILGQSKTAGSLAGSAASSVNIKNCLATGEINLEKSYTSSDTKDAQGEKKAEVCLGGMIGEGTSTVSLIGTVSVVTLSSKTSMTVENVHINAIVGKYDTGSSSSVSGGTEAEKNFYSHQMSLCLDLNENINAVNLYYKKIDNNSQTSTSPLSYKSILTHELVTNYIYSMPQSDKNEEYYPGSKLNPIQIEDSDAFTEYQEEMSNENRTKKMHYLFTEDMTLSAAAVDLRNCHILGDGYCITKTNDALFNVIDENSNVAGMNIQPSIQNVSGTTVEGETASGVIANFNHGFVFGSVVKTSEFSTESTNFSVSGASVCAGGLVGINTGVIMDCMSAIKISGGANTGGVVGENTGNIISTFSVGEVSGGKSFGGGTGSLYSCYTASPATTGVFGEQTLVDTYYDIYATGVIDTGLEDKSVAVDTQSFSVMSEDAIQDNSIIFTTASQSQKFAYVHGKNFGYPTFGGAAYHELSYMQGVPTGDGAETSPILINSVGKLQQINHQSATSGVSYKLIRDISVTADMKTVADATSSAKVPDDFVTLKVVNWKPVVGGSGSTEPAFNGKIDGNNHTISGLANGTENEPSWAPFGALDGATIQNITISWGTSVSVKAQEMAGLAVSGTGVAIENVTITAGTIESTKQQAVKIGGMFATFKSGTIANSSINISNITTSAAQSTTAGGLIGELENSASATLSNINFAGELIITTSDNNVGNASYLGGLIGNQEGTIDATNVTLQAVKINANGSAEMYAGGVFGSSQNIADTDNIQIKLAGVVTLSSNSSTQASFGGVSGKDNGSNFANMFYNTGNNLPANYIACCYAVNATMSGAGTLYAAGIVGQGDGTQLKKYNDSNEVTITNTAAGISYVGALAGQLTSGQIGAATYNLNRFTFDLSGSSNSSESYVGGLVGKTDGTTTTPTTIGDKAKSTLTTIASVPTININADATAKTYVGGIAGQMTNAEVYKTTISSGSTSSPLTLSGQNVGGIAGQMENSKVNTANITLNLNNSVVTSESAGGIAGTMKGTTVDEATITANLTGKLVGGVAGTINGGKLNKIEVSSGQLKSKFVDNSGYVGGIASKITENSNLTDITVGSVTLSIEGQPESTEGSAPKSYIGGIAGTMKGTLGDSATNGDAEHDITSNATINVSTQGNYGGLVGEGDGLTINNATSSGTISTSFSDTITITTYELYIGGLVGSLRSGDISHSTYGNSITVENAPAYLGGLVGFAEGSSSNQKNTIKNSSYKKASENGYPVKLKENAYLNPQEAVSGQEMSGAQKDPTYHYTYNATGGLVGYAKNIKFENNTVNANIAASEIAGGMAGVADNCTFTGTAPNPNDQNDKNNTVSGSVSAANLTDLDIEVGDKAGSVVLPENAYAGGIAGKVEDEGTFEYCTNNATVTAGWKKLYAWDNEHYSQKPVYGANGTTHTNKLTPRDLFYYAPRSGNMSFVDDEGSDLSKNKIQEKVTAINKVSQGTTNSYAGGIFGGKEGADPTNSAVMNDITINSNVSNASGANVTAQAKVQLSWDGIYQHNPSGYFLTIFNNYDAYCHYAKETENAYAAGIAPYNISVSNDTTNAAAIKGGGVVKFNAYSTDMGRWGAPDNYYKSYVLDYSMTNTNTINTSFTSLYDSENSDNDGKEAWKYASEDGLTLVGVSTVTETNVERYGQSSEPRYDRDGGKIIYQTAYRTLLDHTGTGDAPSYNTNLHYAPSAMANLIPDSIFSGLQFDNILYPGNVPLISDIPSIFFIKGTSTSDGHTYDIITGPYYYYEGTKHIDVIEYDNPATPDINEYRESEPYWRYTYNMPIIENGILTYTTFENVQNSALPPMHLTGDRSTCIGYASSVNDYIIKTKGGTTEFSANNDSAPELYSYSLTQSGGQTPFGSLSSQGLQLVGLDIIANGDELGSVGWPEGETNGAIKKEYNDNQPNPDSAVYTIRRWNDGGLNDGLEVWRYTYMQGTSFSTGLLNYNSAGELVWGDEPLEKEEDGSYIERNYYRNGGTLHIAPVYDKVSSST